MAKLSRTRTICSFLVIATQAACAVSFRAPIDSLGSTSSSETGSATTAANTSQIEVQSSLPTVSGTPTYEFGIKANTSSTLATITFTNSGTKTIQLGTIDSSQLGVSSGPFSYIGGSCASGSTLLSLEQCTIILGFSPSSIGAFTSSLLFQYISEGISSTYTAGLSGTSASPANLAVSNGPGTYDFGSVANNSSQNITLTVTNSGGVTATLGAVSSAGLSLSLPYSLAGGGTCISSASLAAGSSCTVVIDFLPTVLGLHSDSVDLSYQNGVSTQTTSRAVQGTSVTTALLTISDGSGSYDYGSNTVGSNTDKTFTITNSGTANATLGTISTAGLSIAAPFTFQTGGSCLSAGTVSSGNGTCTFVVRFTPTAASTVTDTIEVSYNNGLGTVTSSRGLSGTGTSGSNVTLSDGPGTYDFGNSATSVSNDKTFTVTNSGSINATLGTISTAGLGLAAPYTYQSGTCTSSGTLASGGGTCTIVVRFNPSALGTASDSLDLSYNDGAALSVSRALTGRGIYSTTSFTATTYINTNKSISLSFSPSGTPTACNTASVTGGSILSCTCASGICSAVFSPTNNLSGAGAGSFTYTVTDGTVTSNSSTVTVDIQTYLNATAGQVQSDMQAVAAAGSPSPAAFAEFASPAPNHTYEGWIGGVLYYNSSSSKSFIYAAPVAASSVLKLDIATGAMPTPAGLATTGLTNGSNSDWVGGVLAQNGAIYFSPNTGSQKFLKLDPTTDTLSRVGTFSGIGGQDNYWGAVMAGDGIVYAIPNRYSAVLKLDPSTDTTTEIALPTLPPSPSAAPQRYYGGALAFNGKIYSFPYQSKFYLTIDPAQPDGSKLSLTDCSGSNCGQTGYGYPVLAPNGNIYVAPICEDTVLKFVPGTGTMTEIAEPAHLSGNFFCFKFNSGALGNDGKIYFLPAGNWSDSNTKARVLVIDPLTDTASTTFDITTASTASYQHRQGLVSAPNGKLYGIPFAVSEPLVISPNGASNFNLQTLLSPWMNHL